MAVSARFSCRTYNQLLTAIRREAFGLTIHANAEWRALRRGPFAVPPSLPNDDLLRTIAMLTAIMRRASVLIRHIASLPVLDEERDGRIERRLNMVFGVFAEHKIDLATYYSWTDDDLRRELEADLAAGGRAGIRVLDANDAARRPMVLVAELCGDLGIAMHILPPRWLEDMPYELRWLCARAGSSRIGPGCPAARSIRLTGQIDVAH